MWLGTFLLIEIYFNYFKMKETSKQLQSQGLLSRACHLTKALSVTQCHLSVITLSRAFHFNIKGLLLQLCQDNISSRMGYTYEIRNAIQYVGFHNL